MSTLLSHQDQHVAIDPFLHPFMGFPVFLAVFSPFFFHSLILRQLIFDVY